MPRQINEVKRLLQHAIRPEPVEQAAGAVDPIKALIKRFEAEVIPLVEQQREPAQRKALLARLEEDLRVAFKVLDDLDKDLRETRRSCTELLRAARKLRPRARPRRRRQEPTAEQMNAVLEALRRRGTAAMGELCYETGLGLAKLQRILKALGEEGKVERSGERAGTRYRCAAQGNRE